VSAPRISQQIAPPTAHASVSPVAARIAPVAPQGQVLPFRAPGVGPASGASSYGHTATSQPGGGDSMAHYGVASQTGTGYGTSAADASTGQQSATDSGSAGPSGASSQAAQGSSDGAVDDSGQPGGDAPAGPMANAPAGTLDAPKADNTKKYLLIAAVVVAAALAVWVLFIRKPKRKPNPFKKALKAKSKKGKR